MWISDLALNDFRSYTSAVVSLTQGVTVFLGDNGHGKTNLVEAIAYPATFSSHRVSADAALVRQGASAGVIRMKTHDGESTAMLELEIVAGKANRARLNRGSVRPKELLGLVCAIVFSPEDLSLVKGDPTDRRRFLDDIIVQHKPRMAQVKAEYDKVVRQRSALVKSAGAAQRRGQFIDETSFEVWDEKLAHLGSLIVAARAEIVSLLREHVEEAYAKIAPGRGIPNIVYRARVDEESSAIPTPEQVSLGDIDLRAMDEALQDTDAIKERMRGELARVRSKELDRGVCLVGPHRDDVQFGLGTLPAKGYASHGETWSYALALRLASWELLKVLEGTDPILILDDVFAELDARRRTQLVEMISPMEQVFITTAVEADIPADLEATVYTVDDGTVVPR